MSESSFPPDLQGQTALNRAWAEAAFAVTASGAQAAARLWVVHEDAVGDTKVGRNAAP